MTDRDFLRPEEYPSWHPAAQGLSQDQLGSSQVATVPVEGTSSAGPDHQSVESAERAPQEAQRQGRQKGGDQDRRNRNPYLKKGFRRPPAHYAAQSPFAPVIGANTESHRQKSAAGEQSLPLFRQGSGLNEPVSDAELLVQGITPMPGNRERMPVEPENEFDRAKNIVFNQLAAAPKSRVMLERKLVEKGISADTIEDILNRCEAVNLVNDAEFAEMLVRSRSKVKKLSRSVIRRELKSKGIEGELAEIALEQRSDEAERADAQELVRKKLQPSMNLGDRLERNKVMRRLAAMLGRKGYPADLALSVIREEVESYAQEMGAGNSSEFDGSYFPEP